MHQVGRTLAADQVAHTFVAADQVAHTFVTADQAARTFAVVAFPAEPSQAE